MFLLESSAVHVDLHSFPTRRSSDLASGWFEKLLVDYRLELVRDERAPKTVRLYVIYLRAFGRSLKADTITREDIDRWADQLDRKSTRLNSSHVEISYAVFCLKKKK